MNYKCVIKASEEWTTNVLYEQVKNELQMCYHKQVKNELQMCYINKWRMNYKCFI